MTNGGGCPSGGCCGDMVSGNVVHEHGTTSGHPGSDNAVPEAPKTEAPKADAPKADAPKT